MVPFKVATRTKGGRCLCRLLSLDVVVERSTPGCLVQILAFMTSFISTSFLPSPRAISCQDFNLNTTLKPETDYQ